MAWPRLAEGWNGENQVLFYGKGGDIATNRRDEQELSVACLHVLQAAVAYVNTLLVQDILAEPAWADALTPEDRRGLTPLFWTHVARYGEVKSTWPNGWNCAATQRRRANAGSLSTTRLGGPAVRPVRRARLSSRECRVDQAAAVSAAGPRATIIMWSVCHPVATGSVGSGRVVPAGPATSWRPCCGVRVAAQARRAQ